MIKAFLLIAISLLSACASLPSLNALYTPDSDEQAEHSPDAIAGSNKQPDTEAPSDTSLPEISLFDAYFEEYRVVSDQEVLEPYTSPLALLDPNVEHKDPVDDNDLYTRLRKNFKFDLSIENRQITAQINWFIRNPDFLQRTFNRGERYLHYILNEVEKRDLPAELVLLPLVESAYNPFAYSHARASGLWQFIPSTGKSYGMPRNWWYDGRRDVIASTNGALNYLTRLNKRFQGNWYHAIASYNAGAGRVNKAIRRNAKKGKPTDFWSLRLPRETRAYVPKLLAISKIVANPEAYGIDLQEISDEPYFKVVKLDSQIDLAQAAELAEIDIQEIYNLNPGFNRWATAPQGPHRLLLPVASADKFEKGLSAIPKSQRLTWNTYKVKSGDSLGVIARRYHTTPSLLKQINKLRSNTIYINQQLLVPQAGKSKDYYKLSQENRIAKLQNKPRGKKHRINYKVQRGDTLWDIAREHKVGVRSLARWNGMAPRDTIRPGQSLTIWSNQNIHAASAASNQIVSSPAVGNDPRNLVRKINYRVRNGDSFWRIASKFNVSVKELKSWNKKASTSKYLRPGQRLTVFVDITQG